MTRKLSFFVFIILSVMSLNSCAQKQALSELQKSLNLVDSDNDSSKANIVETYQSEHFSQQEISDLMEFGQGVKIRDHSQVIGEPTVTGTVVYFRRVNDIYLDGYATLQKDVKNLYLKIGYSIIKFKYAPLKGRKLRFYMTERTSISRETQVMELIIESRYGDRETYEFSVPYIYEMQGVYDNMKIKNDKPFKIKIITDGNSEVIMYNTTRTSFVSGEVNAVYKKAPASSKNGELILSPNDLTVLRKGKAIMKISSKSTTKFDFLGLPCKIISSTVEPPIPFYFDKQIRDNSR